MVESIEIYYSKYADIRNEELLDGAHTPLSYAIYYENHLTISKLLELGADPDQLTLNKITPLLYACQRRQSSIVSLLCHFNANVNYTSPHHGTTCLIEACRNGDVRTAAVLLESGADPNLQNSKGELPLEICLEEVYRLRVASLLFRNRIRKVDLGMAGRLKFVILKAYNNKEMKVVRWLVEEAKVDIKREISKV